MASGKQPELNGLVFEVQIKTILQHAWTIATHDLIYKTDTVSWPKERIAFQVKAMLEHAEIAIAEAENLSNASGVAKINRHTEDIIEVIDKIRQVWPSDALPSDVKRLAENVLSLLGAGGLSASQLQEIIEAEKQRVRVLPRDLSPYSFVLQGLLNSTTDFHSNFSNPRVKTSLVLQDGMDLPATADSLPRIIDLRTK